MFCVISLKVSVKIFYDFDRMWYMLIYVYVLIFYKEYLMLLLGYFFKFILLWYFFNFFIVKLKDKCCICLFYLNIYSIDVLYFGIVF